MKIGGTVISTLEYHKNMSLVIFLAQCPLRCPYCHNPSLLNGGEEMSFEELKKTIDESKEFIDAIVVSGGEPLVQSDAVIEIFKYAKSLNLKTKLDTSGIYPDKLKEILDLNLINYLAMDVKAPFTKYKKITGSNIGFKVKESMNIAREYENVTLEIRTTFVPTLLNKKDICLIADDIEADIYTIQQFRNKNILDKSLENIDPPNPHDLRKLAEKAKLYFDGEVNLKTWEFGDQIIE